MVWIKIAKFERFWIRHLGVLSGVLEWDASGSSGGSPLAFSSFCDPMRLCSLSFLIWTDNNDFPNADLSHLTHSGCWWMSRDLPLGLGNTSANLNPNSLPKNVHTLLFRPDKNAIVSPLPRSLRQCLWMLCSRKRIQHPAHECYYINLCWRRKGTVHHQDMTGKIVGTAKECQS